MPRISRTDQGIQGEFNVEMHDQFARYMRDRGWLETNLLVQVGIVDELALEIGPGPGYLGLEWLRKTAARHTRLKALDISPEMILLAQKNAQEYGGAERAECIEGDARDMSFEDNTFDSVFTNFSLHEWAQPQSVLRELRRILKPGGCYCISDLPFARIGGIQGCAG